NIEKRMFCAGGMEKRTGSLGAHGDWVVRSAAVSCYCRPVSLETGHTHTI
ncbi:hypothetical protein M9458_010115, partial [Cirrhinus mrigala]